MSSSAISFADVVCVPVLKIVNNEKLGLNLHVLYISKLSLMISILGATLLHAQKECTLHVHVHLVWEDKYYNTENYKYLIKTISIIKALNVFDFHEKTLKVLDFQKLGLQSPNNTTMYM